MNTTIHKYKTRLYYRIFSAFVAVAFLTTTIVPRGFAQNVSVPAPIGVNLPAVGSLVTASEAFTPTMIKGLTIHPENPLQFDFIVDTGNTGLKQGQALKDETTKLVKYFLASLTVPEDEMWVNLSPYESDRIIAEGLGQTDMGRDMLAQDYLLKQLTASLMYPEEELGNTFWQRVYERAYEEFGVTDIPTNTFNKVWIVPEKAVIYEQAETASTYVLESHLKVMLEEDYVAMENADRRGLIHQTQEKGVMNHAPTDIIRELLIPEIEREVNEGKTFANLRQIYNSMILAEWYKHNLKESLLGQVYVGQNKIKGINTEDKDIAQKIYNQYIKSFKTGVYDYIREDYDPATNQIIPRKYFSGGILRAKRSMFTVLTDAAEISATQADDLFYLGTPQYLAPVDMAELGTDAAEVMEIERALRNTKSIKTALTDASMMERKVSKKSLALLKKLKNKKNVSILVAEDDPRMAKNIENHFSKDKKYSITIAREGISFFAFAHNKPESFDVIVSDVSLPSMSGIEVAKKLHKEDKLDTPILIMTGYDIDKIEENAPPNVIKVFSKRVFGGSVFKDIQNFIEGKENEADDAMSSNTKKFKGNILSKIKGYSNSRNAYQQLAYYYEDEIRRVRNASGFLFFIKPIWITYLKAKAVGSYKKVIELEKGDVNKYKTYEDFSKYFGGRKAATKDLDLARDIVTKHFLNRYAKRKGLGLISVNESVNFPHYIVGKYSVEDAARSVTNSNLNIFTHDYGDQKAKVALVTAWVVTYVADHLKIKISTDIVDDIETRIKDSVNEGKSYAQTRDEVAQMMLEEVKDSQIDINHISEEVSRKQGLNEEDAEKLKDFLADTAMAVKNIEAEVLTDVDKATYGGINFDPAMLDMQIKRDGVPLPFAMQDVDLGMRVQGFLPILGDFIPVSLPQLIGLGDSVPATEKISLNFGHGMMMRDPMDVYGT